MLHESFQGALSLNGSKQITGTSIAGRQHHTEVPLMESDGCHVSDAVGAVAADSSEWQDLLDLSQMSTTPRASNVGSPLNTKVKLTPLTKSDAWRCFDVVGAKWELLAAELSELHGLLELGELQVQISTGDPSTLDLSALKARESMPLCSEIDMEPQPRLIGMSIREPNALDVDKQLTESTGVSNCDEESYSSKSRSSDDQSSIPDDPTLNSESIYSTSRLGGAVANLPKLLQDVAEGGGAATARGARYPVKGCKDFVKIFESRLKNM
jgi:hypothetical protein